MDREAIAKRYERTIPSTEFVLVALTVKEVDGRFQIGARNWRGEEWFLYKEFDSIQAAEAEIVRELEEAELAMRQVWGKTVGHQLFADMSRKLT